MLQSSVMSGEDLVITSGRLSTAVVSCFLCCEISKWCQDSRFIVECLALVWPGFWITANTCSAFFVPLFQFVSKFSLSVVHCTLHFQLTCELAKLVNNCAFEQSASH